MGFGSDPPPSASARGSTQHVGAEELLQSIAFPKLLECEFTNSLEHEIPLTLAPEQTLIDELGDCVDVGFANLLGRL